MEERSHLAIGEVLTLLRGEFPDVTISKIRFLESQGLVDPERTPSGYRKFYDADVERLRWILLQQKEHFLPLKVIKDRLVELGTSGNGDVPDTVASGVVGAPSDGGETDLAGASPRAGVRASAGVATAEGPAQASLALDPASPPEVSDPEPADSEASTPQASDPEGAAPSESDDPAPEEVGAKGTAGAEAEVVTADAVIVDSVITGTADSPVEVGEVEALASARPDDRGPKVGAGSARSGAGWRATGTPRGPAAATGSTTEGGVAGDRGGPAGASPSGEGDTLTLDELAKAAGLDQAAVAELQQFGLLTPSGVVGGTTYFDQVALRVARSAAAFGRHGVEARHLRAWRNSAEREVSIFEQVVMPMLRQRNPQARHQAEATLEELAGLGADLRAALVRQALRSVR